MIPCIKCGSQTKLEMRRDVTGKRYYEICTKKECGFEREITKLGPKQKNNKELLK